MAALSSMSPAPVPPAGAHNDKRPVPRGVLRTGTSLLKFYHFERPDEPVPETVAHAARAFLADEGGEAAGLGGDLGFAILRRCGPELHVLLIAAWRGADDLWEAVWHRRGDMTGFAPFDAAYPAAAGMLRATFRAWELGIVAHEAAAWRRFLASARSDADLACWQADFNHESA